MNALRFALLVSLLAPASLARAADPAVAASLALPAPQIEGKVSVEQALHERRSLRNPAPAPLALEEIGQLCWAAQGVTDDKGHRTAPSAHAVYPLELYVIAGAVTGFEPGIYRYVPGKHALDRVASGDKRADFDAKAVGQGWTAKAPAVFVISGAVGKMESMKDRGPQFMWAEAGLAAQGFFLQATAMGLGSTYVGGFDAAAARTALGLAAGQEVLAVLPVGRKP